MNANWTITTNTNGHLRNYNLVDCSTFKPWAYHFSAWRPPSFCVSTSLQTKLPIGRLAVHAIWILFNTNWTRIEHWLGEDWDL